MKTLQYSARAAGEPRWPIHLARSGHGVRLWARDGALVEELRASNVNGRYLPDVTLPDGILPTASLATRGRGARFVVVAVPSHGLRRGGAIVARRTWRPAPSS